VSTRTIEEIFGAGLTRPSEGDLALPRDEARELSLPKVLGPSEHFSTANWCLPGGRSARSFASAAHCESDLDGVSRLRRMILNISGRKVAL
jgi:hypothetical protein